MAFQSRVNIELPAAVHGDFASTNPRVSTLGPEASWYVGAAGVTVGSFVWVDDTARTISNKGSGLPDGFVARERLSLVMTIPQTGTMQLSPGQPVTVYDNGEFWVTLPAGVTAVRKTPVYTDPTTGGIVASSGGSVQNSGFYFAEPGVPGDVVKISSWIKTS